MHAWGGGPPSPDAPPLSRPPTSLTPATSVRGSSARAPRQLAGAAPAPALKWDRCWGRKMPGLAASPRVSGRPTLRGNLRGCKPPRSPSKGSPRPGRGGISGAGAGVRGPREEEGGGGGKVCNGGCLQDLGLKTWLQEDWASARSSQAPQSSNPAP